MRIHSLELSAYGPFPETLQLDFSELNEAGIFLLNGPTGSGKSSILDAICFALYGTTSTNRPDLRSLFAAEDAEPYVRLDFEVQSERYRIRRSPAWNRPKKRRVGDSRYTEEKAKADLDKYNPQEQIWEDVTDNVKEAGTFITSLLGLTREQFTQVMLLPQGEFARFLLSSSKEREELLKKLFSTQEFEKIQEVLKSLAVEAEAKANEQRQTIEQLKHDAQAAYNRAGTGQLEEKIAPLIALLFPQETLPALPEPSATENPEEDFDTQLHANLQEISEYATYTQRILAEATNSYEQSIKDQEQLTDLLAAWNEHEQLQTTKQKLEQDAEPIQLLETALEKAQAARAVLQPAQGLETAQTEAQKSAEELNAAVQNLEHALEVPRAQQQDSLEASIAYLPSSENLKEYQQKVRETIRQLERLVEKENEQKKLQAQEATFQKELLSLQTSLATIEIQEEEIRNQLLNQQEFLAQNSDAQGTMVTAQHVADDAQKALKTAQKLASLQTETTGLEEKAQHAQSKREQADQKVNELYQQRFQQAATILAQELKSGEPCAVCGATEHPQPARIQDTQHTVEEKDIVAAQEKRTRAEKEANRALASLESHQKTIKTLYEDGVPELPAAQDNLKEAQANLTASKKLIRKIEQAEKAAQKYQEDLETKRAQKIQDREKITEAQTLLAKISQEEQELAEEIAVHIGTHTFAQRLEHLHGLVQSIDNNIEAKNHHEHAQKNLEAAEKILKQALADSKFDTLETAQNAAMTSADFTEGKQKVQDYYNALTAYKTRWNSTAQRDVLKRIKDGEEKPTVESIVEAQEKVSHLQQGVSQLTQAHAYLIQSKTSLENISQTYTQTLLEHAPLVEDAHIKRHLADTAAGIDADNTLKMTLTTYVLAAQLAEVARAGSLHLERMTHGRYQLNHSDSRHGRGKAGLDIVIYDAWHSKQRPAASLSGGETFMASLSLALGLADVVQQRNGGIDIATLFVDEGFGTLDEATLEEVMTTLDGLRERGRVIGLISHVSEMKNRISQQIVLTSSPEGSHLEQGNTATYF